MNPIERMKRSPAATLVVVAFAIVYLVWGSTYLAIRFAIETIPPLLMVGFRYLAAGALMYGWVLARGEARRTSAAEWRAAFVYGSLFFLFGNGGVSWAETRIASGTVALLVAMIPLWIALIEWAGRGSKPTAVAVAGLLVGFGGVALLVGPGRSLTTTALDPLAVLACVAATLGWSYGTVHAKDAPHPPSLLQTAAMQMLAGGLVVTLLGSAVGEWRTFHPGAISPRSAFSFAYLVVFGSIVAFSAYTWLLKATRPSRVATYAYVNPIVAVFLGWALAGEPVGRRTIVAGAAVVAGVTLILRARARARGGEPAIRPASPIETA